VPTAAARVDLVDAGFEHRAFAGVGLLIPKRSASVSTTAAASSRRIFSVVPSW
jgi:hypothetical protein